MTAKAPSCPAEPCRSLAEYLIAHRPSGRPLVVGINGLAGSGKTTLAGALAGALESKGVAALRVSVDDFHRPKRQRYRRGEASPEGYYHDSIDYRAFAEGALRPAFEAGRFPARCQTKLLDLARDEEELRFRDLPKGGILLAEGVFLFRPELVRYLDVRIFVRAEVAVILQRVRQRDRETLGSIEAVERRYREKYLPGERLYLAEVSPERLADVLVDSDAPEGLRWQAVAR